jgi:hypothetical protein
VSDATEQEIPRGSVAAGHRARLPAGAEPPFVVYVNGVVQREGADYEVRAGEIVFNRQILKEDRVGFGRWLAMYIGIFGTYRKNETVDIEYRHSGKTELASDVPLYD